MAASPLIIRTVPELRAQIWAWRGSGQTIGFVPTMGALHDGHISLIDKAQAQASKAVVSIYINPTQFGPGEDLSAYPRREKEDIKALTGAGCDLIYIPHASEIYAPDHTTQITVQGPALGLESNHRPGFFAGVGLIVIKLLNQVAPDLAVFGEKDYQQLLTIRTLVRELDLPVRIVGAPIIREDDGLAMSSRNAYFGKDARRTAGKLNRVIFACAAQIRQGQDIEIATRAAEESLLKAGFSSIDYISVVDPDTLHLLSGKLGLAPARLLAAAHLASVRLIDNCDV